LAVPLMLQSSQAHTAPQARQSVSRPVGVFPSQIGRKEASRTPKKRKPECRKRGPNLWRDASNKCFKATFCPENMEISLQLPFFFYKKNITSKKTEIMCQPTNCWGICNPPGQCQFQTSKTPLHSIPKGIDSMAIRNSSEEAVCKRKPILPTTATCGTQPKTPPMTGPNLSTMADSMTCRVQSHGRKTSNMRKITTHGFYDPVF